MKRKVIAALALGALFLGGCSSSNDSGAPAAAPAMGGDTAGKEPAKQDAVTSGALDYSSLPGKESVEGRALVYRGDIVVRVQDVDKAADQVQALATTLGGHISSQKRSVGTRDAQANMTVRVPSKNFDSALDQIADLGKEESRGSNTEDVTEAVVDLETRIAAQKASVESVRKMFERATALSDVVLLERELSQRQAELASLEAKKKRLDDLVALSTINVSIAGPNTQIEVPEEESPGFLGGLKAGWKAFVGSISVLLVVIGWLLPFLVALAIPVVLLVWLSRRRKRPAAATPQPSPGPYDPA